MAIELLASDLQTIAESDNYQVAVRQLGLMNNYIKKFLLLSQSPEKASIENPQPVELNPILENVVFLLSPSAKHLDVNMTVNSNNDQTKFSMSEEDAEQLMMNLISNGIKAASQSVANAGDSKQAIVDIRLLVNKGRVTFSVADNGDGPPPEIADTIFQPFVTGSQEGTGLGLSVVADISNRVGGSVRWIRENEMTVFIFEAPIQTSTTTVS
jgi:signal transduction histidine kinase